MVTLFFVNNLFGQQFNSLPDTLKESDVFGSRNMKMIVVDGIGKDQRKLADRIDLSTYFDFTKEVKIEQSADLVVTCLAYYSEKLEDRKLELDLSFVIRKVSEKEKSPSLQKILKLFYNQGCPEKRTDQVYRIERYMLMLQKNKITPSKIYRAKKAMMMGNPILVEAMMTDEILSNASDFSALSSLYSNDTYFTLLLIGYDTNRGAFQAIISNGKKIWISFNDFMKYINKGYVIIPGIKNN